MYKLKMLKKLAKIKYLPNNFKIIENGDHVLCAVSGKKISLNKLNYWNVDTKEILKEFKNGTSIALMIDQRVSEGIICNLFGQTALTTTIPAQFLNLFLCN